MPPMQELLSFLACPRCDKRLDEGAAGLHCSGCRVDFPRVAEVPWLFAEPAAALGEWRGRWQFALQRMARDCRELDQALLAPELRTATRERLQALRVAIEDHAERLRALLAPLDLEPSTAPYESYLALRTRLPPDQGLTTYYGNIHRDWCWGDEENAAALQIVAGGLAGNAPGKVLVLGAGASRLAYDVHMECAASSTIALDFNPLLVLLAKRLTRGERVELYEFPIAPRGDQAVLRSLAAPRAAREGLHFVLADAHRPPFRDGVFDTVITPWLVDILPERFDALCARINALLGPAGTWLNFGSLSFHDPDPALRYGVDECVAAIGEAGFDPIETSEHDIPYMCSPASRHGRRERTVVWAARKHRAVKKGARYQALPEWLVRGNEPVPLSDAFRSQAVATRIHGFIMSLIDGRRSLKDIATLVAEQHILGRDEAESTIRSFLIKMFEDSRRGTTY
jgi:hypothetical protein